MKKKITKELCSELLASLRHDDVINHSMYLRLDGVHVIGGAIDHVRSIGLERLSEHSRWQCTKRRDVEITLECNKRS